MTKKQLKEVDLRIETAYRKTCTGIQIDIMDISKVFKMGRQFVEEGMDEATLGLKIHEFVRSLSK